MTTDTKNALAGFLGCMILIVAICMVATTAKADTPKPSKADLQNLEDTKENQACLTESRPGHDRVTTAVTNGSKLDPADIEDYNRFRDCKSWNEAESSELAKNGWRVDWATMKLVHLVQAAPLTAKSEAQGQPSAARSRSRKSGLSGLSRLYEWNQAPAYKNERLAYYQQLLVERGITNKDHRKLLTANLIVENGALDENTNGDSGCSVGIPQRYVCQFGYSAKSFRKKYPEWNDWRFQLEWMADHTAGNYEKWSGDVFRTIVSHNSPAAAARGKDSCHISPCYYQRVKVASNSLTAL